MPLALRQRELAIAATAATAAYAVYRVVSFIARTTLYRARASTETIVAPASFLTMPHAGRAKGDDRVAGRKELVGLKLFCLTDEWMGGRSTSALSLQHDTESVVFEGRVSERGRGFASFRTLGDAEPLGLPSAAACLLVDATGDGCVFRATLHSADSWAVGVPCWGCDFKTESGRRSTHRLPLASFVPSKQTPVYPLARELRLNPKLVTGIGFSLSLRTADGKRNPHCTTDGGFRLVVHNLRVTLR